MKKIIGLLTVVMVMMLSSCAIGGAPGLIGKWYVEGGNSDYYYEYKADDTVWYVTPSGSTQTGKVKKSTCKEITVESTYTVGSTSVTSESTSEYELSCDKLVMKTKVGSTTVSTTYKRKN